MEKRKSISGMENKLKEGERLYAKGKISEAENCFLNLLKEDPENPEALNNLGVIHHLGGDFEQAEKYLLRALAVDDEHQDARSNLADLYETRKRDAESVPQPSTFRAAFTEINITPNTSENDPVLLQGFAEPQRKALQIIAPLKMQCLLLEDLNLTRILIVAADLFGFGPQMVNHVRAAAAEWGIPPEAIVLNASHTHYAPGTIGHANMGIGLFYAEYALQIAGIIPTCIDGLFSGLVQANLYSGWAEARIGVNRRSPKDGRVVFDVNPDGLYVRDTPFLVVEMVEDQRRIILANHGCHPTGLGQSGLLGPDFPHSLRETLMKKGGFAAAMFLQGAAGDIKEAVRPEKGVLFSQTLEDVDWNGSHLAGRIIETCEKGLQPVEGTIFCADRSISLPLIPVPDPQHFQDLLARPELDPLARNWAAALVSRSEPTRPFAETMDIEAQLIKIGGLTWISLDGEPTADLGEKLRELSGSRDRTFILGYTNGLVSYLPTDQEISEGGYEVEGATIVYLQPAPLAPGSETALLKGVEECLAQAEEQESPNGYGRYHLSSFPRRAFFVLSTGRCGTKSLTHILNNASNAKVWHHPRPFLINETLAAYSGELDKRSAFWRARGPIMYPSWADGLIHGETDLNMTPFADVIADELPEAKFLVLVRDPRDFVRSGMRRNYYCGHPWDPGRLRPRENSEEFSNWSTLDQFEKVCWLWAQTYGKINTFIQKIDANRIMIVRFEDLMTGPKKSADIYRFLGLKGFHKNEIEKTLRVKYNQQKTGTFPKKEEWSRELTGKLWRHCAQVAKNFGYQPYSNTNTVI